MSNIKVIDINEETKQEATEEPQVIEEAKEEIIEDKNTNEVIDTPPEEEVKEETKETTSNSKQVKCPKCSKSMTLKNFRYRHEKLCTTEPKPVKPQAKPKGKAMPKPKAQPIEQEQEEIIQHKALPVCNPKPKLTQPVSNQILKPSNPLTDMAHHYQLLQQQFMQQKKEKYNNLCQNMFAPKSKKR